MRRVQSYASTRIRGAILDELRSLDWVPRSVRREARKIERATVELSTSLHRTPTDAELAAEMSIDTDELDASLQRVADARMVALDHPWTLSGADSPETTLLQTLPDLRAPDPAVSVVSAELRQCITMHPAPARARAVRPRAALPPGDAACGDRRDPRGHGSAPQLHAMAVLHARALLPDVLEAA